MIFINCLNNGYVGAVIPGSLLFTITTSCSITGESLSRDIPHTKD